LEKKIVVFCVCIFPVVLVIICSVLPHSSVLPCACPGSCRIDRIHFLTLWHKRRLEPTFSFVRFSFVYVSNFQKLLFGYCWSFGSSCVWFYYYQPSDRLTNRFFAAVSWIDPLRKDLYCVECDVKPYPIPANVCVV